MNWIETLRRIEECIRGMNQLYRGAVFNEWAVLRLDTKPASVVHYTGPRRAEFTEEFSRDMAPLRREIFRRTLAAGDFEFAPQAAGSRFDVLLKLGPGCFLLCNDTAQSMAQIRENPHWLEAQVPFVELSEKVRASPLRFT
jgi:hypothetical protein